MFSTGVISGLRKRRPIVEIKVQIPNNNTKPKIDPNYNTPAKMHGKQFF